MQCEIIRNNEVVAGPMAFDPARVRDIVMRQGGDYRLIPNGLANAIHLGAISVLPVNRIKPEITVMQSYGNAERSVVDEVVVYTHPVVERDLDEVLEEQKSAAMKRVSAGYQSELNAILRDYLDAETKTWDKQEQEARAWAADNTVATPLLTEIANARGMALADLVPRVIAKADAWMQLSGAATGKRQKLESDIDAATTVEEVEGVQW